MSRSPLFHKVRQVMQAVSDDSNTSLAASRPSRREFLGMAGAAGLSLLPLGTLAAKPTKNVRIAIVGAGLAGLACADRLQAKGYQATVYEASGRLGGRCYSNRTLVPGMACENGGEFIDTGHKTMLAYAREFNLPVESVIKKAGDERFYFGGQHYTEDEVVAEFREVVANMQPDLRSISGGASFYANTAADRYFDELDLQSYFASRCAGHPLIEAVLNEAYLAEYGLETSQQSSLNFIGFMRLNKQSKFEPFGVSDERFHIKNGNDGIIAGLESKLQGPKETGARLTKLAKNASGDYLLYFNGGAIPQVADVVVLAIPFTVLRTVDLDPSLGFSADKLRAIDTLGYGMNSKTMVAFNGRSWWTEFGASGTAYSDLGNLQNCWETNRANATSSGIITDYASGNRSLGLSPANLQAQVSAFVGDFDQVFPGLGAEAAQAGGQYVAHLEHWPTNPNSQGSYTCYLPGQFTGIEGLSGEASGLVKFAGEHADSFYSWQGYMEGACLSGIRAANEVLDDIKKGRV